MRLVIFNGSPRGAKGNTQALISRMEEGFTLVAGNTAETVCLRDYPDLAEPAARFAGCDAAVLAFPLYVDSMPALVKEFIEALEPYCARQGNPALGFVVISGFPEAVHTSYVRRYLEKLAARMGSAYAGTVTRGNAEGIRWGSERQNRKLFAAFRSFGATLASAGKFDGEAVRQVAGAPRFSRPTAALYRFFRLLGLTELGWNNMLKRNDAYDKRLDRPYSL